MRTWPLLFALLMIGCGGETAGPLTGPTPPPTFTGRVIDTVTGQPVSGVSTSSQGGRMVFSAPGYVTRETSSSSAVVDLIPEAGFNLTFYRQLARNGLEGSGTDPLRVLTQAPSIYLQRTGLSDATVTAFEATARTIVPAMTGGRLAVTAWEYGNDARSPRAGWITVELISDDSAQCGRTTIGAPAGQMWLNTIPRCHRNGAIVGSVDLFAHELGHALGFYHVPAGLMQTPTPVGIAPSALERHHAAIAYARTPGNRDVDVDP